MKTLIFHGSATLLRLAVLTSATACADPIIYATGDSGSKLLRVDVGSSNVTVVGSFGFQRALGITIHPLGGVYTAINSGRSNTGEPKLATVDLATGKATLLDSSIQRFMGLIWLRDGRLLGVNARWGNSFYVIDPVAGTATRLGAPGAGGDTMDMAWHPDGTLYAIEPTALYRVDPVLGRRTFAKSLSGLSNPMGLAIDHDGTMYAAESIPAASIFRINPATGQATRVVRTGIDHVHGLEIAPHPMLNATLQNGQLTITWPGWATGHILQFSANSDAYASWAAVPTAPVNVADRFTVTLENLGPRQFFRLLKQ